MIYEVEITGVVYITVEADSIEAAHDKMIDNWGTYLNDEKMSEMFYKSQVTYIQKVEE